MYTPKFQPQLTGISTAGDDCGPRACQMGMDWATHGSKVPRIPTIRGRMLASKTGPTNTLDWEAFFKSYNTPAELANKFKAVKVTRMDGHPWSDVITHLEEGKGVILAVDYGVLSKLAPGKTGSPTFKDSHAILFLGIKGAEYIRSFDDLNDHRRRGIPQGPVWVKSSAVKAAAMAYGAQNHKDGVFGLLIEPATPVVVVTPPVIITPPPMDTPPTLSSILSDLYDLLPRDAALAGVIEDMEDLIGPYKGPASPNAEPTGGLRT